MSDIELAMAMIIPFALFALGGAAVYAVFVWRNTDRRDDFDPGIGTPRRIYFYLASFVSLMMAAGGASSALAAALDSVFRGGDFAQTMAMGLALVAVGLPVWLFHWRFVQRAAERTPGERRSVLRNLHVYTSLGVALGFIAFSAFSAVRLALFAGEFDGFAWGGAPVWAAVWAYHWRVASNERAGASDETLAVRRMYIYLASAVALAMAALGVGILARAVLLDIYQAALGVTLPEEGLSAFGEEARAALAAALVGGAGWAAHWLKFAKGDRRSALRWAYLLIAALGGGFGAALIGVGFAVFALMLWSAGGVEGSLAEHFATLPSSLVVVLIAAVIWRYHVGRSWPESGWGAPLLARIYMLALSAMGLAALALAAAATADALTLALAELAGAEEAYTRGGGWELRHRVAYIMTLLSLGGPAWGTAWRQSQKYASEYPQTERVGKMYALGVICVGLLALIGGASATLFVFLNDLLADGALSAGTLLDLSLPISALLPPALILPYHWIVYRRDGAFERKAKAEVETNGAAAASNPVERKEVTLLAPPESADALATLLAGALGYPVTVKRWSDSKAFASRPDENAAAAASRAIAMSSERRALVVAERGGLRVIWGD